MRDFFEGDKSRAMTRSTIFWTLLGVSLSGPLALAQIPRQQSAIESYRRQDWTGKGTYHRLGLIREQDRAVQSLETEEQTVQEDMAPAEAEVNASGLSSTARGNDGKKTITETEASEGFLSVLNEYLSVQGRANSMFFGSSNILNTQNDPIQAGQFAQFLGASVDLTFREWKLATSYDYAWFRFYDPSLSTGDFNTSTIRQALSYEKLCVLAGWLYLHFFVAGRETYAVGGNEEAARFSGLSVHRIKLRTYALSGLAAGIAGMVSLGRFGTASTSTGTGYELTVIASAVVGGASLAGGKGTALGALLGTLIIALIENGILILRLEQEYRLIIIGLAIVVAVALERLSHLIRHRNAH